MRADGFTYVELLLAMAFMTVVVLAAHQALLSAGRRAAQLNDNLSTEACLALNQLAAELGSAGLSDSDTSTTFVVRQDTGFSLIDFVKTVDTQPSLAFQRETVFVERDADGGHSLSRRTGDRKTYLCGNVTDFDVSAFDGERWQKQWGWNAVDNRPNEGIRGLPTVVMVRLTVETASAEPSRK